MSYSSIILIEELTQAGGSTPRTITLVGPSLPLMGASWEGQNKLVTEWNPGNSDEATQQNLGPEEMPSDWEGDWRRTMMGSCPTPYTDDQGNVMSVVDPSVLRDAMIALFRAGRRLRVTWSTTQQSDQSEPSAYPITGSLVREGRAKSWKFKHRSIHDIEWNVNFEWVSTGGAVAPSISSTRDQTLAQVSAPYVAALQNLLTAAQAPTEQLLTPYALTLGNLEAVAPAPFGQLAAMSVALLGLQANLVSIAGIGAGLSDQPVQVAQMALAYANDALAQVDAAYEQYSAMPPELMSANVDAVSVLRAYALFAPVADTAAQAEIQAYAFRQKMHDAVPVQTWSLDGQDSNASRPDAATSIKTVHLVRDGDTPEKISMKYYHVPDHARDIMQANRLSWHTTVLPKGRQLVIPVISSSTQTV